MWQGQTHRVDCIEKGRTKGPPSKLHLKTVLSRSGAHDGFHFEELLKAVLAPFAAIA